MIFILAPEPLCPFGAQTDVGDTLLAAGTADVEVSETLPSTFRFYGNEYGSGMIYVSRTLTITVSFHVSLSKEVKRIRSMR